MSDIDFKLVLEEGLRILTSQAETLETEIKRFGIGAPPKPPDVIVSPAGTNYFRDRYMYRMILIGLQALSATHASSLKQCTYNDRIRNIFRKMLVEEIDILGRYIKFGKLKGWLYPSPAF